MNGHRYIATLRIFHRRDLSGSLQTILTIPTLPPRSPYHHTAMTRRPCLRPTTYDLRRTYDPLPDIILDLYSIPTSSLSTWVLHIVYIINRSWTSDSLSFVVVCCCLLMSFCRSVVQSSTMRTRLSRVTVCAVRILGSSEGSLPRASWQGTYVHTCMLGSVCHSRKRLSHAGTAHQPPLINPLC